MSDEVRSFRDLKVWQLGMELVRETYVVTASFPKEEIYGLTNQLRRAAVSIPANIAEGAGRDSLKEYLHHLSISAGSLCEVDTMLQIGLDLRFIEVPTFKMLNTLVIEEGRMLRGLQKSLRTRLASRNLCKNSS